MLYEKLSKRDIQRFRTYVQCYAGSENCSPYRHMGPTEDVLRCWAINKERLYKMFGEKFILEQEVELVQPRREIEMNMINRMDDSENPMYIFKKAVYRAAEEIFGAWTDEWYHIHSLFDINTLIDNHINFLPYNTKSYTLSFPKGEVKLIENAKTMKTLSKIADMLELSDAFEQFRLEHSMTLNRKMIKGTLCLSIHPLDYITMSDNANNWHSCMNWQEDGDYRVGTIEMMNSPSVVVAYLKSNDRILRYDDQEWNSKIWRTLLVITPEIGISVKGYPYQHPEATKASLEWLRQLALDNLGWEFGPYQELDVEGCFTYNGVQGTRIDMHTNRMYNDFGSTLHYGYLADCVDYVDCTYSADATCIYCGDFFDPDEERMVCCRNCADIYTDMYYCDECGERYHSDDMYWVEDTPICYDCFHNVAIEDGIWGDYLFKDNAIRVFLASENDQVDIDTDSVLWTHERATRENVYTGRFSHIGKYALCPPRPVEDEPGCYYWNYEDLTDDGLKYLYGIKRHA